MVSADSVTTIFCLLNGQQIMLNGLQRMLKVKSKFLSTSGKCWNTPNLELKLKTLMMAK